MIRRAAFEDRPTVRLVRHFFNGFFDLGFLSEEGTQWLERWIVGVLAVFFSFGLLILRVFIGKYVYLSRLPSSTQYAIEVQADHAFIMALPMVIVALVTILVSHALFPDETDFRVLMPLPIPRRVIFTAKLAALGLFAGLFITFSHAALTPLVVWTLMNRWAGAIAPGVLAFLAASVGASLFAMFLVVAVNGMLVTLVPRTRLAGITTLIRSLMVCVVVLSLPLVSRLTAQASAFGNESAWLFLVPPAWFVGVERLLLGHLDGLTLRLAGTGLLMLTIALGLAVASYLSLYRHFDRVLTRPVDGAGHEERDFLPWAIAGRPGSPRVAVRQFTTKTLWRSVLHQGIFVALGSIGLGIVFNSLLGNGFFGWLRHGGPAPEDLTFTFIWAPFVLIYTISLAVRASLVVPIEQRANWVFRMTEREAIRADELKAASHVMGVLGIVVPIAIFLPFQWITMGGRAALTSGVVTGLWGAVFVEVLLSQWQRIPFTSSYIPGKRFVPQTVVIGFFSFILFTTFGYGFVAGAVSRTAPFVVFTTILAAIVGVRRVVRLKRWREMPLMFEDLPPTDVQVLGLHAS